MQDSFLALAGNKHIKHEITKTHKHLKCTIFFNIWPRYTSDNSFEQGSQVFCKVIWRKPRLSFNPTSIYRLEITLHATQKYH